MMSARKLPAGRSSSAGSLTILINASNLKKGGGLQVGDSLCRSLNRFGHRFVVVLSSQMRPTADAIRRYSNVEVVEYDITNSAATLMLGRDTVLDGLVKSRGVDVAFTIFGPARWSPRCPHLCGFARSHLVMPESPFFKRQGRWALLKSKLHHAVLGFYFKRGVDAFWTENPMISERLKRRFHTDKVYTVTNYYNQVFDRPEQWREKPLRPFTGTTLLTVSAAYPHKNLEIAIDTARILKRLHPDFAFRFVYTIAPEQFPPVADDLREHFELIGRVDIAECPGLYRRADVMFQPSLLECFSATYPEAMKMEVPIVTADLAFARGLCGDAAIYYDALSPRAAADAIYRAATDRALRQNLVTAGRRRLHSYDNYTQRVNKIIVILEKMMKFGVGF